MPHLISLFALAVFPSCCCTNQCTMSCHTGVFIGPDERLKGPGPQGPRQPIHLSYYLGINGRFSSGESTCWWMKAEESLKYVLNLCWVALNLVWKYPYTLHSDKCHLRSGFMAFLSSLSALCGQANHFYFTISIVCRARENAFPVPKHCGEMQTIFWRRKCKTLTKSGFKCSRLSDYFANQILRKVEVDKQ